MPLDRDEVVTRLRSEWLPAFGKERDRLDRIDRWYRWEHDKPHAPRASTVEYKQLIDRAQSPWLGLVVTDVAQALYVEGYRQARAPEDAGPWRYWQANRMDARQIAIHRAALAYGLSYVTVLPGEDPLTGEAVPVIRGRSPRRMMAFYGDVAGDDWPTVALHVDAATVGGKPGMKVRVYDDANVHHLTMGAKDGSGMSYAGADEHGGRVCPVVRFANDLDLEGRVPGEVEPFISIAGRIDQTVFDRLVVQRFASWVVRTISGMARPDSKDEAERERLRLRVEDLLVAEDPDTKFGHLPASDLLGFIAAKESDVRDLAAMTQTPPHHLLGQMANLSAEALAAAESALMRKVVERQHTFGESHEQVLRLSAAMMGDADGARDVSAQVRWRDTESRSLAQAADALGKLAEMLQVPVELLWEKIPGWTQQDVERAKALLEQGGGMEALLRRLEADLDGPEDPPADPPVAA